VASVFSDILQRACTRIPGALGGAFAANDGVTVDSWTALDEYEWEVLTAHFGVILSNVQSALRTRHFGEAISMMVSHDDLDIYIHAVKEGYYAVVAVERPRCKCPAQHELGLAARLLEEEMG
jgi:predicted regulator of Ras-like GTPase activity (Roadblock/LC7/MglB family)